MKELFENLQVMTLVDSFDYLIDTCFFIWIFEHHKDKDFENFIEENRVAMTSFNIEEFLKVEKKIGDKVKKRVRKFLHKKPRLYLIDIPVKPGNSNLEHIFVKTVLPELDEKEHDPSDAVLLATAIRTGADVLTRDKHDMFNSRMENFLKDYNVKVLNSFP